MIWEELEWYIPRYKQENEKHFSERDLLYKVLFDMKKDITELKKIVIDILDKNSDDVAMEKTKALLVKHISDENLNPMERADEEMKIVHNVNETPDGDSFHPSEIIEESLSLQDKEKEMIRKALEKHNGKRKDAARELGISERTLYRKIKEYQIR